jgi:outer membrane protein TolC
VAQLDLKRLLNVPLDQPIVLTSGIDASWLRESIRLLVDTAAVPNRPALRSAELAVRARLEAITVARADYYPTLAVSLTSGFQAFPPLGFGVPTSRGTISPSFCDDPTAGRSCQNGGWFSDRTLNATATWPLFDGFRTHASVDLAKAQSQVAELQLRQQREVVALDVARTRSELSRALAVFEARRQNAAEAVEAFQLASLRFSTGLSTQLEVSDAQLSMLNAQSGALRSVYDLYLAATDLARALGQPVPTPPLLQRGDSKE